MALTANQDWLYKQMSGMNVDLGSEEQFAQAMQDESNRQWVYEQAGKMGIDLGTPEQFASAMQMPFNPRVKGNEAPTTEAQYQANLQQQDAAQGNAPGGFKPFAPTPKQKAQSEKLIAKNKQLMEDFVSNYGNPNNYRIATPEEVETFYAQNPDAAKATKPVLYYRNEVLKRLGYDPQNFDNQEVINLIDSNVTHTSRDSYREKRGPFSSSLVKGEPLSDEEYVKAITYGTKKELNRSQHEAQWAEDQQIFERLYKEAEEAGKAAERQVVDEYNNAYKYSGMPGGTRLAMRAEMSAAKNAKTDPAIVTDNVIREIIDNYESGLETNTKQEIRNILLNSEESASLSEQELDAKVNETYEQLKQQSAQQIESTSGLDDSDIGVYIDYVQEKLQQKYREIYMPKDGWEYFARKVVEGNLIGQAVGVLTKPLAQRQYEMQGTQRYANEHNTTWLDRGAEGTNLLLDLPLLAATSGVGEVAKKGTTRLITRGTTQYLKRKGIKSAADVSGRMLMQRQGMRAAMNAIGEGVTFGTLNTIHAIGSDLYQEGQLTPRVGISFAEGLVTGGVMGSARVPMNNFTSYLQREYGTKIGTAIGRPSDFLARTTILAGGTAMGEIMNGQSIDDIDWAAAFKSAAELNLAFGFIGGVKMYSANRFVRPDGTRVSRGEALNMMIKQMQADPNALYLNKEDIEQLNRAGVEGKDASEIIKNIVDSKPREIVNSVGYEQSVDGRVVSREQAAEPDTHEIERRLETIFADPEIDTAVKQKLFSIFTGKTIGAYEVNTDDAVSQEEGKYVVRTYDNAGFTYKTRIFDTYDEAEKYRQRQVEETRPNLLHTVENISATQLRTAIVASVQKSAIDRIASEFGVPDTEVRSIIKRSMDDTLQGKEAEDAIPLLNRYYELLQEAEKNLVDGQMTITDEQGVTYTSILRDPSQLKPLIEFLNGEKGSFRRANAKIFAKDNNISEEKLLQVLDKDYAKLSDSDRKIYDDYIANLQERLGIHGATYADAQIYDPVAIEMGISPSNDLETQISPVGGTPVPPTREEVVRQKVVAEVTPNTHKNGYVYPVKQAGENGKDGFVVGGEVVVDTSNPDKPSITNDDIVTVKWSDGTVTQERARDLDLTGAPMMAQQAIDIEVENQMYAYTQQRIQNGEQPVLMRNSEDILEGFFPTEGGLLEDRNGVQYTPEQLAEQGWQETKPVLFVNDQQQIAALDNGDGTYTQVDALGTPIAEPMSAEAFREQGFAMVPLEEEQPKSQAPVEAPVVEQAPEVQQPEVQEPAAPVVPNIETMSAEELGGSAVEYMGDRASAMAYLEAERDKADDEVRRTSKLKVSRFDGPADFKRQNDQIQAAKRAAIDRYNKLQNAITAANAYKTVAEQQEEAERKAREAAMREQRRQLAEAETAGDIEAKWQNTKKTIGFAATKTLPNGQKVNGHYILTEAGDVVPSHDPRKNYADSEGYLMENGQNVNDNNYKDPDVQRIALDIAQNYGGQAVEQMPFLENRAGRVLSGNNRTISGIIAAENNTDQAYLAALAENAQQYGFTPEQLAEYEHPRLQFVVEDELPFTTATFAMFNQQEKKTKSSVNRAIANSKMVTEAVRDKMLEVMDQYDSLDSFFGSENAAADIVQSLISEGLMTQQEVAGLTESTSTGFKFSQSGREYVTDMLLGTLFDEQTIRMLAGEKTLKQAILRALPSIVENRRLKGYELTESINKAVQILYEARKANEGKSTAEAFQLFLRQVDAFEGKVTDRFDGFDIILANRMSAGVEQLREMLNLYNNSARDEANGQMGFFEPRSSEDIKQDVYEYYTKQQPDLAAALNGAAEEGAQPQSAVPSGAVNEGDTRQEEVKIVPERPNSKPLQGMTYNVAEAEDMIGRMVRNILSENGYEDVEIVGVKVIGSRVNGDAREDSDLDAIVEFKGDAREDSLFNLLHGQPIEIDGVTVDINPITEGKSGTIEQFMRRADEYLAEKEAAKAENPQENLQESEKSSTFAPSNGQSVSKAEYQQKLSDYLDSIADEAHKPILFDDDTLIDTLISVGADENAVRQAYRVINNGGSIEGFFLNGHVCLNVDKLPNQDIVRSKYVHERQHDLTRKDVRRVKEVMNAATEDELKSLLVTFSNTNLYDDYPYAVVADEFISFAMEEAYKASTGEELTKTLQEIGVKDELINIIKSINDEQRSNQSLSMARRTPYLGESAENSGAESRRDSKTRAEGGLVEERSGIDQSSVRRTESGGRGSSKSQVTHPTTDAAEVEIGGALVDRLEDMGLNVSTDLAANLQALKEAKADKSEAGTIHYFKTPSGKQYGFAYKGKVYLDPTKIDAELPIHEYGHLWAEALRRLNPENWQRVVETIKADKDAWAFVRELRPELTDENEITEEVIATFSGKNGAEKMRAEYERMHGKDADYKSKWGNIFKNISKAIQDFWKAVGDFLNIKYTSAEQVYDQVLKDFVDNMNPWKRVSDYLQARDKEYVQAAESGDIKTATDLFYDALKENIGNGITPYMSVGTYTQLKRLAKGVKTRNEGVIKEAAAKIAPLIPDNAVLIPAPSHDGRATDMLDLAKAVAEITGSEVADVLRSAPRESQYQAKKATGVPMVSGQLGITMEGTLPEGKTPIIIDNVVDSGNTAEACVQAVGRAVVVTIGDSAEQYRHAASLKSAAPVLRDKAGKVIPLSKRFEPKGSRYLGRRMYLSSNDPRFAISGTQVIPVGEKTLVGLHNISAEKLRKALKAGGLANPSAAVIDIARQNHHDYGDISLIMPSSLVDSKTGRNAGTFTGDIWSPTYPHVEKQMSDKGDEAYYQAITKAFGDNEARRPILSRAKLDFDDYLDSGNIRAGLAYWYLLEKGIEPGDVYFNSGISDDIKERFRPLYDKGILDLTKEDYRTLLSLIAEKDGKTAEDMLQDAQESKARYQQTIDDPEAKQFYKKIAQQAIDEIDLYGVRYNVLNNGYHAMERAIRNDGKIDLDSTLIAAQDIVQTQHQADFDKWISDFDERFDISEVLFQDYDRDGNRIYKPHTLANVSRMMNKEDLQNAGDHGGLGATRGILVKRLETLADIRAEKGRLRPGTEEDIETEEWNKMQDEWFNKVLNPLSDMQKISDNPFSNVGYAETRLQEALRTKDPIAHLNKEYGYHIAKDGQWAKDLADMVERVKNLPTKYFETKFRRPVYLNEFANAVVPNDLPQDLRAGLESAGLRLFSYDPNTQGSRRDATLKATEADGIRFSISSAKGSPLVAKRGNLQYSEGVLPSVAKEMESIKNNAINNGTFMQAPNGKPTNLDERQWLQVRTENFKRWFGDWQNDPENASKVLDENGEPMVVYHGSNRRFNIFKYGDLGFHFGTQEQAEVAAEGQVRWNQKGKPHIIQGFLNIRNPYRIEYDPETWNELGSNFMRQLLDEGIIDRKEWENLGYDGLSYKQMQAIREKLQAAGYDGVIYPNWYEFRPGEDYRTEFDDSYIALSPNQIKSATDNDGSFSEENDDIRFAISNQNNDIFYSNAERAVEGIKQEKATPEQWRAMIEKAGGLKAGEDKWIGLSDWLAQQRPTVTPQANETRSQFVERAAAENKRFTLSKQDLLDYIREHKIQIEEIPYAEGLSTDAEQKLDEFNAEFEELIFEGDEETGSIYTSDWVDYAWRAMVDRYGDDFESAFEIEGEGTGSRLTPTMDYYGNYSDVALYFLGEGESRPINGTRLQYTTDGLQNKREIALVVPTIESWNQGDEIHFGDAGEGRAIAWVRFGDTHKIKEDWTDGEGNLHKGAEVLEDVLVIDEIQSKRHQEGREHGYRDRDVRSELKQAEKELEDFKSEMWNKYVDQVQYRSEIAKLMTEEEVAKADKLVADVNRLRKEWNDTQDAVPSAPFEKNWHELAMKRILRFAAENGYDKVAWTTGDQQAARYNIGEVIDSITRNEDEDYPYSYSVMSKDHGELEYDFDENGIYHDDGDPELDGKSMSDVFGKELAKRLQEMPAGETIDNEGLRIGGEGMRGFYDDILPRFMQKYGKKWGVHVGEVTMPQLEDGYQTMHAIDINDAMRESVMEGQPMFSISGRGVNGTIKPQEGETRSQYIARVAETVKNMTPRNTTIDDAIRFSITVNHNSPYLLKRADGSFVDPETGERLGFDHRFMGKGEGGQAHGWGSYFSVNDIRSYASYNGESTYKGMPVRDIPQTRENLAAALVTEKSYYWRDRTFEELKEGVKDIVRKNRKRCEDMGYPERGYSWMYQYLNREDYQKAIKDYDEDYNKWLNDLLADIDALDEKDFYMTQRHHYTVDIPDNDGTNYLEENDEPMDETELAILRNNLEQEILKIDKEKNQYYVGHENDLYHNILVKFKAGTKGRDIYPNIAYMLEDYYDNPEEAASKFLHDAGFMGIHYDGRRDGECYVIFDENDAKITDHIRFSVTGSRGAANIDKMEGVTTRMDNLAAARQMEEDGKDAKTIRMATGWERGADGKWRYEIDDVQLNADNVKANFRKLDRRGVTAPMVWYHNKFTDIIADSPERKQLLAAYPQLADLDIEFYDYPNKERGAYSSEKKKISVNRANVRSVDECRSVLLHEIQHAIQEAELFAKGTSKEQIQLTWKLNNEVHNKVDEYFDKMGFKEWLTSHNGDKAFVNRLMQVIHMFPNRDFNIHYLFVETLPRDKQIDAIDVLGDANDVIQSNRNAIYGADRKGMTMKPDELYHNAAGEVESRNVQNRMNLTPEERRERLLAETEDVAREDQVVIMNAFDVANDSNEDDQIRFSVNNPSTLSRSEIVTKALVQQANNNYNIMQSALKKVTADLKGIRAAMRMQSDYDRKVVDALLNLYNTLLQENGVWAQYMPDTTRRIATQIVHAIGKQNITEEVNTIMDHMVHAQAKAAQRQWDKLRQTPIDKINISGVVMQGKVALEGQHALKAMNDALQANMTIEQIEEQINQLMDMEDNATDESLKTQYKGQWIGLTIAAQHLERLQHLQEERQQLDLELQSARSNKALKPAARQQLVDNIKQTMRDNYIEQAEAYTRSTQDLSEYVNTQEGRAKDFIRRQDANRDKIRSYAQRDLEGLATNPNRNRTRGNVARSIWDAFASPIRDLQSLLRLTGMHAPDGEGYLYNHFMRNWMDGADKERTGIVAASKTLDEKIAELTHGKYKTWEEAARKINDASHNMFTITMLNGVDGKDMPVTEEIPLNAGNALYIYAVNKMNDGRMKLNGMNITEEDVQALADKVREQFGQEILDVVDWVQAEFFSQLRNRYNPTHEALFGAPMDAIENYFPLRINANARQQNEDLSEPDTDAARLLAGTSTGAIKRRTRNSLPLDVRNADFFQEVIRHISQMERWNAFVQWNRDANILFSDINFRNRIKGMKGTIYGEGDKLYNYMKDAFRVAIGTYKPKTDTFSEITLNMAKGVTSAKINFRIFTALKQIASFPAFFTYMQDGVFVQSYLRNWLRPHETMKWAKENLPNFEKRVSKRDMGDMRLMQRSTDWQWNKRILEWSSKYGMFFNVFFDTLTCATGARAVYDSHLADYLKKGYSEEDARNRARQDAEQAFNTSQQSSEGAFMSAVQQDRNLVTAALTVFRTSPIQYTRNFFYHTRNLLRKFGEGKRDEQIAFRMGQYKNDGLNDEQARKAAEKDYNKSLRQDIVGFVVYGALLNILWRLAGQIPYLLLGDDDDKKKQILDDATSGGAWFSPFTGLLGGGIVESALDGNGSVADMFAPEMPFTQDIKRAGQYLSNDKYAEFASQALSVLMQSGTGFDPLTASDMVSRIVTTLDSEEELDAATQALRVSQALLSIPQSQYEQMLIDKVVSGETDEDAALEDYIRYQKIHTAPLTWWLRGEESDEKAEENAEKRFSRLLNERDELHNPEEE